MSTNQWPISWLCLPPNYALTITILRLRASADFLRQLCKRRKPKKQKKNKTKLDLSFCHNKNKVSGIGEYKNTSLVEIYKATIPRSNAYSKHFTCTSGLDRPKGQEKVTNIPIFVKYVKPFHMMYRLSKQLLWLRKQVMSNDDWRRD